MEVLSSRILLRPSDFERSLTFYGDTLGLPVYREYGEGRSRGVVFFLGGGFLEVSGRGEGPISRDLALWLQVRDVDATHDELVAKGVTILRAPVTEPWGLREMWVGDPDRLRLAIIEVPADHPLRRR
jgi:catechol 2,3-dioxygenase-like lactoylglutathione lyase family enzyme